MIIFKAVKQVSLIYIRVGGTRSIGLRSLPQRLKPDGFSTAFDTAEAVPLQGAMRLGGNA